EKVLKTIKDKKYASAKQIEEINKRVKQQVEEAVKFAEESPLPSPEDIYNDVYSEPNYPFIKE
ncbi:MAG TPA: pyruvate dehydrogenase (acetyl-transferring) E1 component subunit alpha, partial [Flavobacteriales bacterium]|nr:pyruvate dehydrogenase (acetyl-transferring) E1 component subunit alpha [Flavobacteriales bacterium]